MQVPALSTKSEQLLQARAGRKFRYTGNGTVETLIVKYSPASTVAKGTGTWTFNG